MLAKAAGVVLLTMLSNSLVLGQDGRATEQSEQRWQYDSRDLQPVWKAGIVRDEPVLFFDSGTSANNKPVASGAVLFSIAEIVSVRSSSGQQMFVQGRDYQFSPGSCEILIPAGSRVKTTRAAELRRPANSQKYNLTHRDGGDEILFGPKLEYHAMQTLVTYRRGGGNWPAKIQEPYVGSLPSTVGKLLAGEAVSIVLLGDSISTGCNASAWGEGAPFQPAYQDLLVEHLRRQYESDVELTNLSVGGQSTPWGITMIDKVVEQVPDLVILAFGMNDSASLTEIEYGQNTLKMIARTRQTMPEAEFILVSPMLGNRDWVRLKHDVFPKYRTALAKLAGPGIALADMTSIWSEMLKRKKHADLTGNGVNHPNDFGHRVYAQVLAAILAK